MTRHPIVLAACLAALALGCRGPALVAPSARPKATPGGTTRPVETKTGASADPTQAIERARGIRQAGEPAILTGKVRIISDKGSGVISNHGGQIVSNHGAGVVSNNGGGVIGQNGGGIIGHNGAGVIRQYGADLERRRALAQAGPAEALLADARIEVLDANGALLVDEQGEPLSAVSGPDGAYRLQAVLPAEGVVLRVRLARGGALAGGELRAVRARDAAREATIDLDTAASLGASYILERYLRARPDPIAVLDKLPALEATRLHEAVAGSLSALDGAPSYEPAQQVAATERLRQGNAGLRASLTRIEALLLAGQRDLGAGQAATAVGLVTPKWLGLDPDGQLLIGEGQSGRVRRVLADGTMDIYADARRGKLKTSFGQILAMCQGPDGALYVAEKTPRRVRKLWPDGRVETVAGASDFGRDNPAPDRPLAGPATAIGLTVYSMAVLPDGRLAIGGFCGRRLMVVGPDGLASELALSPDLPANVEVLALDVADDGAVWAIAGQEEPRRERWLLRRAPDGTWAKLEPDLAADNSACLARAGGGAMYVSESTKHRVRRFEPNGASALVAGTEASRSGGDGGPATAAALGAPRAMVRARDGTLYVVDGHAGTVRAIAPDGIIRTVAGAIGMRGDGSALSIGLARPGGLALDPQGRVIVAEAGAAAVRRLEGEQLVTFVGGIVGDLWAGSVPVSEVRLRSPFAAAYDPTGALWLTDDETNAIIHIDAAGQARVLAGGRIKDAVMPTAANQDGRSVLLQQVVGLAIGPDGAAYVADKAAGVVLRVDAEGQIRVVAGKPRAPHSTQIGHDSGDGGPALEAELSTPTGLAFRPGANPPELLVADAFNCRVRRVVDPGGPAPRIETFMGKALVDTVMTGQGPNQGDGPLADTLLALPVNVCFDAAGDLYVAEAGTQQLLDRVGEMPGLDPTLLPVVGARIRRVAMGVPGRPVTTVAGAGGRVLSGQQDDGLGAVAGMVVDRDGRLILADPSYNQLKLIPAEALR